MAWQESSRGSLRNLGGLRLPGDLYEVSLGPLVFFLSPATYPLSPLQLTATCNVEQSFFNDWFCGHLNLQIEHQ